MGDDGLLSQADIDALTAGLLGNSVSSVAVNTDAIRPEADIIAEQTSSVLNVLLNRPGNVAVTDVREADKTNLIEKFESDSLIIRLPINTGLSGELCLFIRKDAAAKLCGLMMGGDGSEAFKDDDIDAMNEFGNQFMGSVCTALGGRFATSVSAGQAQTSVFDPEQLPFGLEGACIIDALWTLEGFDNAPLRFLLSPPLTTKLSGAGESSNYDSSSSSSTDLSPSSSYNPTPPSSRSDIPPNMQMLLDINLNITIELGRTRLSIRKILEIGPGSIIELDRLAGEPVDLLVNDKVVAKGEVVVVDEYFGIRILTLVSPEERIKQLK